MDSTWARRCIRQAQPLCAWSQAALMMTTTQVALLALPVDIYWEKLAGWDLPGKSEETTNAKVHGWNWVSKAVLILESVFILKVALVIFAALQWLLQVPESPFSPRISRLHAQNRRRDGRFCLGCSAGGSGPKVSVTCSIFKTNNSLTQE